MKGTIRNIAYILLLPAMTFTSCIRDEIEDCPPLQINIAVKVDFNDIYLNSAGEKRSCSDDTINTFCIGFTNASIATKQLNIILNFITNPA